MKQYLNRTGNKYFVVNPLPQNNNVAEEIKQYQAEYEGLERDLQAFMKDKKINLNQASLCQKLNNYILENDIDKKKDRKEYIYLYEFLSQNKEKYEGLLQTIKEGAIFYEGLSYRIEKTNNKAKIIIFLDTEILFHAMDYNGRFYKQKFDEFYELVSQYDETHLLMPLFYTEMVEEEIKSIFESARKIKEKKSYRLQTNCCNGIHNAKLRGYSRY